MYSMYRVCTCSWEVNSLESDQVVLVEVLLGVFGEAGSYSRSWWNGLWLEVSLYG